MSRKLPQDFIDSLERILGEDMPHFLESMVLAPAVSVRLNPAKPVDGLFAEEELVSWNDQGRYLQERPLFTLDPLLHAGAYYVQDASSMVYGSVIRQIVERVGLERPRVLDLCAAPGGKTTAMIGALPEGSTVVANEFVGKRLGILRENLSKWGYTDIITTGGDTSAFAKAGEEFDIVAVDAPCSGEGMMRKDDEAVRQWTPGLTESCASLQREILANAMEALKPGGMLIYSTCTFNTLENEDNFHWLRDEKGLEPIDLREMNVPEESKQLPARLGAGGALRFMPHFTRGEGLFICAFRKKDDGLLTSNGSTASCRVAACRDRKLNDRKTKKGKDNGKDKTKTDVETLRNWVSGDFRLTEEKGKVWAASPRTEELYVRLKPFIGNIQRGVEIAELKGRDFIPTAMLAHSGAYRRDAFPYAGLDREAALSYLRREAITLGAEFPKGIVCVGYQGLPLGFVKNIGSRANNLYPAEWRILIR